MDKWLKTTVVSVDIETNTNCPVGQPGEDLNKYGVSYLADITDVGLYAPGLTPLAFDMSSGNIAAKKKIIVDILSRDNITIIGHKVIFDLRQLGGHYGFRIARHSVVWCTQVMSIRMMLGEVETGGEEGFTLLATSVRLGVLGTKDVDFISFYEWMKKQRATLSQLAETLATLPKDRDVWRVAGGYTPPNRPDLLKKVAQRLISIYVVADAVLPYLIYQRHLTIIEALEKDHYRVTDGIRIPKWPQLPSLMNKLSRLLRVEANQAIRGVDVDLPFLHKKMGGYKETIAKDMVEVYEQPDPNTPYPEFDAVFGQLLYYKMVLDTLRSGTTYSKPTGWKYWNNIEVSDEVLRDAMVGDRLDVWVDFLQSLDPLTLTRGQLLKKDVGKLVVPNIDLHLWVKRNCFSGKGEKFDNFYADVKTKWLTHLHKLREILPVGKLVNKSLWKPYYIYVVCGVPLPTSDQISYMQDLTVGRFQDDIKAYTKINGVPPTDYITFAIEKSALSYGTKAMDYFLKKDGPYAKEGAVLGTYRKIIKAINNLAIAQQIVVHAARDGKNHSEIMPSTRTSRDSSSSPNLQNVKITEFAGVFVAPEGYWLLELDHSNAENKTGAIISKSNAFAMATESGDFHSNMAKAYWPDQWEKADGKARKDLRARGKPATFGSAYGMGAAKLAQTLWCTLDEAKTLLYNKEKSFPEVPIKKKVVEANCAKRVAMQFEPSWIPLWTGARVIVPRYRDDKNRVKIAGYKGWNYLQQGGVAEMVHLAMVEAAEWLEDNNYKTYIAMNVHDSIIVAMWIEEYSDVLPELLRILCRQMPEEYCNRTSPPVHFVSEIGPENAIKWGYRDGKDYPFPLDEFVNKWGIHKLPDNILALPPEKREAPTWIGPEHEGYTLEKEMAEIKERKAATRSIDDAGDGKPVVKKSGQEWAATGGLLTDIATTITSLTPRVSQIEEIKKPRELRYVNRDGVPTSTPSLLFHEFMAATHALYHKGYDVEFTPTVVKIDDLLKDVRKELVDLTEKIDGYRSEHEEVLYLAPPANTVEPDSVAVQGESTIAEKQSRDGDDSSRPSVPEEQESAEVPAPDRTQPDDPIKQSAGE